MAPRADWGVLQMLVLGIESSCDETAAALVRDGHEVLSSVISSQIKLHAAYGGVIPELAAREHLKNITPVVEAALREDNPNKVGKDNSTYYEADSLMQKLSNMHKNGRLI